MLLFPTAYSTFDETALGEYIADKYKLGERIRCRLLLRGMNDTYYIETEADRYIFRVYRSRWRSDRRHVVFEVDLLIFLRDSGVAVSYPILAADGSFVHTFQAAEGNRYGVLFSYAAGEPLSIDSEEAARQLGAAAAKLHQSSDNFCTLNERPPLDLSFLIDEPLRQILPHLANRPEDYAYLLETGRELAARIDELHAKGLDWGICHGDLHGGNVHFQQDIVTFFDFDLCGYGWRAYDLAVFNFISRFRAGDDENALNKFDSIWNAFVLGYRSIRELSEHDLEAIPLFCGIRQLWLMKLSLNDFRDLDLVGSVDAQERYLDAELAYMKKIVGRQTDP